MGSPRLERVTPDNVLDACRLTVAPEQESVVAPVARSLAEAYAQPDIAWPRLVYDGEDLVGFIMGGFDPTNEVPYFRCGIWRLNIAAGHQKAGYGRFAVTELLAEARRRGNKAATVLWVEHPHGPEGFYLKLGFRPTGERFHGEVIAVKDLTGD
ncbi:MAG TPA: GNAT family N-acetyltransferase [Pseudonocardiaceae bacterium]|nr:GNAT family N-acetyltransferase [Pseudonocardiaceae bacterium]